jgi:hypothetical protein
MKVSKLYNPEKCERKREQMKTKTIAEEYILE